MEKTGGLFIHRPESIIIFKRVSQNLRVKRIQMRICVFFGENIKNHVHETQKKIGFIVIQ